MDMHRDHMVATRGFAGAPHRDAGSRLGVGLHADFGTHRPLYLHARYYDRPDLIRYSDHHIHMYYDPYNHLHHRIIWPSYYYPVCYSFGPYWGAHYVWPYYHRKYVFISLGGWWPDDYTYMRYYWYGYHPYVWYGYYPVAREVVVGSDNYYTYNYNYYGDDGSYPTYSSDAPLDPVTQARLRANLEQQKAAEPAPQTIADTRFEEGVKSFEAGDYAAAAVKFDEARRQSPQDVILPYAYAQALFADGQYDKAADVLRDALKTVAPDKEGIFFPRGLYANDDVLFAQVEKLLDKVDKADEDADLQLLLGYQLLGVGETGYAREPLEQAAQDPKDATQAGILLKMLDKMEKEAGPALKSDGSAGKLKMPEMKADKPAPATVGEMMSTAATGGTEDAESMAVPDIPAEETPMVPMGVAPETPVENKSGVPEEKPSDGSKNSMGPVEESTSVPMPGVEQSAINDDSAGWVETGQVDNHSGAVDEAGLLGHPAGLMAGLSRLAGSHTPNHTMDIVIFVSILSLALVGVWIEWRLLGRRPV
jgi:tetratricopeptide (TPR) repeat protein